MPDHDPPPLEAIRSWVSQQLGLRYDDDRRVVLARRLAALFGDHPGALTEVWQRLRARDPSTLLELAEIASTNHTYFFREPEAFELLARHVAPTLPAQGPLRVWSAAASSGEEAYSIAMTLVHVLGRHALERLRILGTDISDKQVRAAERAEYEASATIHVPVEHHGHFLAAGSRVRVRPELTRTCTFRRMNLASLPWPFAHAFHVIFLRNVLYYFDPELRDQVIEACYDAAAPGAHLVVGLSEPLIDVRTRWQPIVPGLYAKPEGP